MMHGSGMRLLCMIVCLITALGSIHLGLLALGYNALEMLHIMHYERMIYYIFGACGVISFIKVIMGGSHLCHSCEDDHCK